MLYFWKTKDIIFLYSLKRILRSFKEFKDVLADAESSFKHIKKNGFIIFDDFNWFHYEDEKQCPAHAINIFLNNKINEFEIIYVGSILIIKKI